MRSDDRIEVTVAEARAAATAACIASGASPALTHSLVEATLSAERFGRPEVGFRHMLDYLQSLADGRIDGRAEPLLQRPLPAVIKSDARYGIAQLGFDRAFDEFTGIARTLGVALFTQTNSYTAGELGYYVRRLALENLISMAVANGPALMAAAAGGKPVYCTNPLAFGAPTAEPGEPLVIDQASSATAFVNIVKAAETGAAIPEGWAIDESGEPTSDAREAVRGAMLPFGGYKGANIALMVEILAAGIAGASWSIDAADYRAGHGSPRAGLTILAVAPTETSPQFQRRLGDQVGRLEGLGVRIPGRRARGQAGGRPERIVVEKSVWSKILSHR